jgi:hypothetical protein
MSYLDRIAVCHRWDPDAYRPFIVESAALGRVTAPMAERLRAFPEVFTVSDGAVGLNPDLADFDSRSAAVEPCLRSLAEDGLIRRWRGEAYPVLRRWGDTPYLKMERAAVPLFGVRGFGVHVNGFVGDPRDGIDGVRLWVGRRAKNKHTAPGKLDHIIAGGQPYGLGIMENLVKEAGEEAGLPESLARRAVPVGAISYICERDEGLRDDVLFCFDLLLPADVVPRNTDGEVESFELWPMTDVLRRIRETDDFKFNVNLVILDFAIRHGFLTPDDPDYQAIWEGLRLPARYE